MKALNILVAEDNDDHAEMIMDALEDFNSKNEVLRFTNGEKIVEHLKALSAANSASSKLPDLILLDIKMPIMDGLEALKLIKSDMNVRHIPIMMVSTSENAKDVADAYKHGANSYIIKPFDYDEFMKKITELNQFWADVSELPSS